MVPPKLPQPIMVLMHVLIMDGHSIIVNASE